MSLRVCPACGRHAREERCPFCGGSIIEETVCLPHESAPQNTLVSKRVSRSVVFATAAATLALVTDCGNQVGVPFYGGCPGCIEDAASDTQTFDSVPFYGGCPACFDAPSDISAKDVEPDTTETDAGDSGGD